MSDQVSTINLSDNHIRIAQFSLDKKEVKLKAIGETDTPFPIFSNQSEKTAADTAQLIENLIKQAGIKIKNAAVIIPDDLTFTQILELPLLPEKELLSAVKYQAEQIVPMPVEQTALDISLLSEDKKNKKSLVLIVAAPKNLIDYLTKIIEISGLIPESIENELSSFSYFISRNQIVKPSQSSIFFNLSDNSSSLYFYHQEKNIISDFYNFNIGYNLFIKEIKIQTVSDNEKIKEILRQKGIEKEKNFNLEEILQPLLNELGKNLTNFLEIIQQKYNVTQKKIYFLNRFSEIKNLDKKLGEITGIVFEPFIIPTSPTIVNSYSFVFSFAAGIE